MTAQKIHLVRIQEHLQELKDAVALGLEYRPATLGFHSTACAIDLLETYLHKVGKIPIGMQVKHDWFKRPKPGQKIIPLVERKLQVEFSHKAEIIDLLYDLEEQRNTLIYGNATPGKINSTWHVFQKLKQLLLGMLREAGEEIEDPVQ